MADNPFLKAADIIRERGWTQKEYDAPDGRVCILAALRDATFGPGGPNEEYGPLYTKARDVLDASIGRFPSAWNDEPSTTYEDVILELKKAAVEWDVIGGPDQGQEAGGDE